jgi:hypothetical protein
MIGPKRDLTSSHKYYDLVASKVSIFKKKPLVIGQSNFPIAKIKQTNKTRNL